MGTGVDGAIVSIGAVEFDIASGRIKRKWYRAVDLKSSMAAGGIADAETIMWWMSQSEEAIKALTIPCQSQK